jgi:hypothetical protein
LQANIDAEAATRAAADSAETSARTAADAAEALARAAADAASLATANAYTDAETTRATAAEATKAKLAGGNSFTGDQTITAGKFDVSAATATLPVQTTNTTPPASGQPSACLSGQMLLQTNGAPGQQLFICNSNSDGKINFAAGQNFPGTQDSLTAGTGISILSNTVNNTGVLSFNGRNGSVSPASGDYSFAQISSTFTPSQAGAGTYAIEISGNAATATLAANATNAANASVLSGEAAATAATASTIAARRRRTCSPPSSTAAAQPYQHPHERLAGQRGFNNQANTYPPAASRQSVFQSRR